MFFRFILILLFYASTLFASEASIMSDSSTGESLVDKTIESINKILKSTKLPTISLFLKRIAKVESHYGEHALTFRDGYYGGIWQVDRIAFEETKNTKAHPKLKKLHHALAIRSHRISALKKRLDWQTIDWKESRKAFISCLAARLYLATIPESVPDSLNGQAQYWKKYYNTSQGQGTEKHFIEVNS
jgi:hypothetical protein